jgi:4-hydroxyphenylpyruvate dioxygenase
MGAEKISEGPTFETDLGTSGFEFIEFAASDATEAEALEQTLTALGFVVAGRHRTRRVLLFRQEQINIVLNSEPLSFARSFAALHGPSVCALGFRVENARRTLRVMRAHGAEEYSADGQQGQLDSPAIRGVAGTLVYLVDLFGERGSIFDADFEHRPVDASLLQGPRLSQVDHIAQTVPSGTSRQWISYYARHFGLSVLEHNYIPDAGGWTISTVMGQPGTGPHIILNDPRTSDAHAEGFLKQSLGGGVQHIAFVTDDIFEMLERARDRGLALLPAPSAYYGDLKNEGYDPALVDRLQRYGVMMDTLGGGRFLHAYTKPMAGRFFFEIVQRINHSGFGLHDVAYRLRAMEGRRDKPSATKAPPPILEDLGAWIEAGTTLTGTLTDLQSEIATPEAMGKWFAVHGIDAVWLTFRVAAVNLERFVDTVRVLENLNGFTVTAPHKAALVPLLDQISERARRTGAVNVVRRENDGRLVGDNMEGLGLLRALEKTGVEVSDASVWLVGAGTTGRAIAWALAEAGIGHLSIKDIDLKKAAAFAAELKAVHRDLNIETVPLDPRRVDIAVNATPIGYHPLPFELNLLRRDATVADVVLTPPTTNLVKAAEEHGHNVLPGEMLLEGQLGLFLDFLRLDS